MRKLLGVMSLAVLFLLSQVGVSDALGGRGPDVTIPTIQVVPGTVTSLVKKSIRGLSQLDRLNADSTALPVGSNGTCSGGGSRAWDEGFGIQWQYYTNGSGISYHRATATHYCGTQSYQHHAHGTLIRGWDYEGDQVWSDFNNPCDSITKNNDPEIATCSSPFYETKRGAKWLILSGQYFDQDFNPDGSYTWDCPGCMDTQWTMP